MQAKPDSITNAIKMNCGRKGRAVIADTVSEREQSGR
jgi:hypothetical protein